MQGQPGFMGFNVISEGDSYTVSSRWARNVHRHVLSAEGAQAEQLQALAAAGPNSICRSQGAPVFQTGVACACDVPANLLCLHTSACSSSWHKATWTSALTAWAVLSMSFCFVPLLPAAGPASLSGRHGHSARSAAAHTCRKASGNLCLPRARASQVGTGWRLAQQQLPVQQLSVALHAGNVDVQ